MSNLAGCECICDGTILTLRIQWQAGEVKLPLKCSSNMTTHLSAA